VSITVTPDRLSAVRLYPPKARNSFVQAEAVHLLPSMNGASYYRRFDPDETHQKCALEQDFFLHKALSISSPSVLFLLYL